MITDGLNPLNFLLFVGMVLGGGAAVDATDLRLILANHDLEAPFLIGHENSFFHGKTTFRLSA